MTVIRFLSHPFWQQLGLTLIHFLWQGVAVALLVTLVVYLFRLGHGRARHRVYLAGLALMVLCPLLTFMVLERPTQIEVAPAHPPVAAWSTVELPSEATGETRSPSAHRPSAASGATVEAPLPSVGPVVSAADRLRAWLPWAVAFWMTGVAVLSFRLLLGYIGIRRWQRRVEPLPERLRLRIVRLTEKLGLPGFSRVYLCPALSEATAVGYLRPMVLLPAAMLTRMPPAMVEAVIAHELAHIRRLDLWVNLAQRIVETLLFYHPAVWWLSNRLRAEREFCCDEMAVEATGERLTYAAALETAQRGRLAAAESGLALALGRGTRSTLNRVRHILGLSPAPSDSRFWLAGVIVVGILAILAVPAASLLMAQEKAEVVETDEALMFKLMEAAEQGDIEQLKSLIAAGADINAQDLFDKTALHIAAERDHLEAAKLLIAHGADVNLEMGGWTPLFVAAFEGHGQIAELLLKNGAEVDADDGYLMPLFYAVLAGSEETVKALIAHGADVNRRAGEDGYVPLVYAMWQGHAGIVKALIEAGADVNAKDRWEWTVMHHAILYESPEIRQLLLDAGVEISEIHRAVVGGDLARVKSLIESGIDVNTRDAAGKSLVFWAVSLEQMEIFDYLLGQGAAVADGDLLRRAAQKGLPEFVQRLIDEGADVNARTGDGRSPLWKAIRYGGHEEVCRLLIAAGADVNAALDNGRHPLGCATSLGHEGVVRLLLANGADVDLSVADRGSALTAAVQRGRLGLMDLLIAHGADVNAHYRKGTPLHSAILSTAGADGETVGRTVKKLLDHGAKPNAMDRSGRTPLHLAAEQGQTEAAEHLLAAGADVNAKDHRGYTPLSFAVGRYDCREVAELLRRHGGEDVARSTQAEDLLPARTFNSEVPFRVWVVVPGRLSEPVGFTPAPKSLLIPESRFWFVEPRSPVDMKMVRKEVQDKQIPGLFLRSASDADLAHLEDLKELTVITVVNAEVTNAGLAHIETLTGLQWLDLRETQITEAGLAHLKDLQKLRILGLSDTQITDSGLTHLRDMRQLQRLFLRNTRITDDGIAHLRGLKDLSFLNIRDTRVTDAGVEQLKKWLPNTEILH